VSFSIPSAVRYCLLLLSLAGASAQAQNWVNPAHSVGGIGSDYGAAYKANASGERFVTGYFSDSVNIGGRVLSSLGDTDIFLAKEGAWVVQIGGTGVDEGTSLAFDTAGNVYLTGWFTDSASFSSTNGQTITVTGASETIFLAKYDVNGVLQWVQTGIDDLGGINRGHAVSVDPVMGAVFLTGMTQGNVTFTSSGGSSQVVSGVETWHMYLVRYDAAGNFQWGQTNTAAPNSIAHGIAIDSVDNVYVTGWFEGSSTFSSTDGNSLFLAGLSQPVQQAPDYPDDAFVVKYDANGNVIWASDIGGYKAMGLAEAVSSEGNISVTGFVGNIGGGTTQQGETDVTSQPAGTTTSLGKGQHTSPYNRDLIVLTYDPSGVLLTALRKGGTNHEAGEGIAYSGSDVYVAVDTQDTSTLANTLMVAKYTGATLDWAKSAPGAGTGAPEQDTKLSVAPDGEILVTGWFTGSATFGEVTLESQGAEDIFFARLLSAR
jgi:hypothetical protein